MEPLLTGVQTAFDRLGAFAPSLIAGLVVLLIGYVIARILAGATRRWMPRVPLDRLLARLGVWRPYEPSDVGRWASKLVFWAVMLVTIMQVSRVWGLTFVAVGFATLIAYLPHVVAAAVVFGVALVLSGWVRDRMARSAMLGGDRGNELRLLPSIVRGGILTIGAFMALRELQIAPQIVNVAFTLTLGAIALAGALAFGLGGRDVAGRIAQGWYERRRELGRPRPDATSPRSAPAPAE